MKHSQARSKKKVLPPSTRKLAKSIQGDSKKAKAFLHKAGIVTQTGKLTAKYK